MKNDNTILCTPGNYYGNLEIKESEGKFYWSVEDYDGHYWHEIPESLYREIEKFESNN